MPAPQNLLKLAIQAAGGPNIVASRFGMHTNTIYKLTNRRTWPAHLLRPLVDAGQNVITLDQLLTSIEEFAAEQGAEANVG